MTAVGHFIGRLGRLAKSPTRLQRSSPRGNGVCLATEYLPSEFATDLRPSLNCSAKGRASCARSRVARSGCPHTVERRAHTVWGTGRHRGDRRGASVIAQHPGFGESMCTRRDRVLPVRRVGTTDLIPATSSHAAKGLECSRNPGKSSACLELPTKRG